jgi:hypothetical protein
LSHLLIPMRVGTCAHLKFVLAVNLAIRKYTEDWTFLSD